jgi:hypothetical protein
MIIGPFKRYLALLKNPSREFDLINKRTFEEGVADYMILLVAAGIAAGIASFLYIFLNALYMDIALDVGIEYIRMLNYSIGRSVSILFFYLFSGTFLLFFVSIPLRIITRKISYSLLLRILMYSLSPMLLFGWILPNPLPLLIWSSLLFVIGVNKIKKTRINKGSIERRD